MRSSWLKGSSRNSVERDRSGPVSEKNGFSVVAPMSTSKPSSTWGRSASCCVRLKRWTSSRNRIVPRPCSPMRARARSATSRTSFTPAVTADNGSNAFSVAPATRRAIVVLPVPGGPQRITDESRSASMSTRSGLPGPSRCCCPTTSSSERGRSRAASGARPCSRSATAAENRSSGKAHIVRPRAMRLSGAFLREGQTPEAARAYCQHERGQQHIHRHRFHRHRSHRPDRSLSGPADSGGTVRFEENITPGIYGVFVPGPQHFDVSLIRRAGLRDRIAVCPPRPSRSRPRPALRLWAGRDGQAEFPELRRIEWRGRPRERIGTRLRLRERDHLADVVFAREHRRQTVDAEREARVRRRAETERLQQEPEARLAPRPR